MSPRWAAWRAQVDLARYDARWEQMAARGEPVHGEADLVEALVRPMAAAGPVLDAGCGTGRLAVELDRRGIAVVGVDLDPDMVAVARRKAPHLDWVVADLATLELERRFPVVVMAGNVLLFALAADHGHIVRSLARHLEDGGLLVAGFSLERGGVGVDGYDRWCTAAGLELAERWSGWDRRPFDPTGGYQLSVHRRPPAVG